MAGVVGLCAVCGCAVVGIGLASGLAPSVPEFFQRPSESGPSENPPAENPAEGSSPQPTATFSSFSPQVTSAAPGGPPGYAPAKDYAGTWGASWENQTFGSSGPVDVSVEISPDGTATFTMDLGGMVSGQLDPDPATYQGSYNDGGVIFTVPDDPVFGELTIVISGDGTVVISAPDVPDNRILSFSATGTITPDTLTSTISSSSSKGHPTTEYSTWTEHPERSCPPVENERRSALAGAS